ncbi:hypothetical protein TVAG_146640 [Trichomonas vaginalis G3]|uniref:Uncharacterized protein n=1 Tax=Trichomonas vaginalis (strain ATCC PRA-98 / G3) TaxID=412133 RepID=A2DKW8_TRIV3|nr:hypothetical protein TVAGG3_0361630 [Trichomonas vaginalis G3]EAY18921.1 hypothetical protein TVAG_146640 [Trichomonas vaginalis G3]KAI5531982.1 hypothetical protein TVAGG3_0361630 [Trichomonas vaginalis G3]|eukprot:XP_001579907.1 hypothetical protein [Trichomonas vaginalis G3]
MRKLYLDFKYLPTNLTLSTPEYFIFDKTKISNETNLALEFPITIDSESKRDVVLNTLHLQSKSVLDLTNNVKIFTNVLNVSTSKQPNKVTLNTKILSLLEDSFTTIDKVNGVEFIDIHYSVFKLGFIHINSLKSLKANNQTKSNIEDKNITLIYVENAKKAKCPGGLHVRFYNDDIEDQFFYDGDWDDFNIDFICFDSFEVNESCLSYEFISHHWDFNGSTRTFDMSISKKNSQTCISLVHRDADSKDGSKNPGDKKIKIIIYSLIGVLIVIIIVIIAVAVICKKRNKKKYIIRFASDNASEALTESLLAME